MIKQVFNSSRTPERQLAAEIGSWFTLLEEKSYFFKYVKREKT
jgi:hypothetical protein